VAEIVGRRVTSPFGLGNHAQQQKSLGNAQMNPDSEGAGVSEISAAVCISKLLVPCKKTLDVTESEQDQIGGDWDVYNFLSDRS
jgi:hypothetical protein